MSESPYIAMLQMNLFWVDYLLLRTLSGLSIDAPQFTICILLA
jgi:hypothetical protein